MYWCACLAGVVPEPASQVAEEGEHEEGSRETGAQRPAADVQRRADPGRRAETQGGTALRQEATPRDGAPGARGGTQDDDEVFAERHPAGVWDGRHQHGHRRSRGRPTRSFASRTRRYFPAAGFCRQKGRRWRFGLVGRKFV